MVARQTAGNSLEAELFPRRFGVHPGNHAGDGVLGSLCILPCAWSMAVLHYFAEFSATSI